MRSAAVLHPILKQPVMKQLLLLPLVLLGTLSFAQQGEIRGRVFGPTGESLPMAHVTTEVAGQMLGAVADMDGRFVLKPLPPGTYQVKLSYAGYRTKTLTGIHVTDRATYLSDERLAYSVISADTVEVIAYRRKLIDKEDPSRMSLLAEDLAHDATRKDPAGMVEKNFPGVTRSRTDDGLHFRGSRTENMVAFVDGVKVSGAMPRVPPSGISSISVYTGGLPARYGDVTGGVVVLETKNYFEMYEQERARQLMLAEKRARAEAEEYDDEESEP